MLGEHDTSVREGPERRYKIKRKWTHPNYTNVGGQSHYDFRLLELAEDVELSRQICPVCLPDGGTDDQYVNAEAMVSGWGKSEWGAEELSKTLQLAFVNVTESCGQYTGMKSHHLCASGRNEQDEIADTCTGDSGGECIDLDQHQMIAESRHAATVLHL